MTMLASTVSGDAYTFRELSEMHSKAGFGPATHHAIPNSPHTVVTARV